MSSKGCEVCGGTKGPFWAYMPGMCLDCSKSYKEVRSDATNWGVICWAAKRARAFHKQALEPGDEDD